MTEPLENLSRDDLIAKINKLERQVENLSKTSRIYHRFKTLYDHSAESVLIVNPSTGLIVDANRTAEHFLGYNIDELRQLRVHDIDDTYRDMSHAKWHGLITRLKQTSDPIVRESVHQRRDGLKTPVELTISYHEFDNETHLLLVARDIRHRRAREAERQQLLLQANQERTLAQVLNQISVALNESLDLEIIFERLLSQIKLVIDFETAAVIKVDGDTGHTLHLIGLLSITGEIQNQNAPKLKFSLKETPNLYQMMTTHRPLVIPSTRQYPGWIELNEEPRSLSWAGAPIIVDGKVVAFLSLAKSLENYYQPPDAERLTHFAVQAGLAIKNAQRFEQTRRRAQHLSVLNTVGQKMTEQLTTQNLCDTVVNLLCNTFGYYRVAIYHANSLTHKLTLIAAAQLAGVSVLKPGLTLPFDYGFIGKAANKETPYLCKDTQQDPDYFFDEYTAAVRSMLAIPLKVGDHLVGVIDVSADKPNAFQQDDIDSLITIADQLAVAWERTRLFDETNQRALQLHTLNQLAGELIGAIDVAEVCKITVQHIANNFHYYNTALLTIAPNKQHLVVQASSGGYENWMVANAFQVPVDKGIVGRSWRESKMILMDEDHPQPDYYQPTNFKIHSELVIPIKTERAVLGVLAISCPNKNAFNLSDISALTTVADQATIALENARLLEDATNRATELEVLRQASLNLTSTLNLRVVLVELLRSALLLLHFVDNAYLFLYRKKRLTDSLALWQDGRFSEPQEPGAGGLHYTVAETGQPLVVNNLATHPKFSKLGSNTTGGVVALPLKIGERVVGIISLYVPKPHVWASTELGMLYLLADQAAIAIENARLYESAHQKTNQMEQIVETTPEGLVLLDGDLNVIVANNIAKQHLADLGLNKGHQPLVAVNGLDLGTHIQTGEAEAPTEITLSNGATERYFELVANPLNPDTSQNDGWVMVLRETTADRSVKARMEQQARLAAVGQLAAGIAHDFNNILTGILGFADLLQRRADLPPGVERSLSYITKQGQKAAQLVRQILDFARESTVRKQTVDFPLFLEETVRLLRRIIPENVKISLQIVDDIQQCRISVDPNQIQQVITNLALNAKDAMPNGGTFSITLSDFFLPPDEAPQLPDMDPGRWVLLTAGDTGSGMPPEVAARIFEPFYTTKDVGKGTGLGLAQAHGIISQHGGHITVNSTPGSGTTFFIYLPAIDNEPAFVDEGTKQVLPRGQQQTILLVEDNDVVREVTQTMLTDLNYRVLTAPDGKQALEIYRAQQAGINLVLTDATMPEMGGIDLFKALQAITPKIKVIVLSGYPLHHEDNQAILDQLQDWLQKPLTLDKLAQSVAAALN